MNTKKVKVGKLHIGGDAPVTVQSMCNTDTSDTKATTKQIHDLEGVGCEIVRVAVPDMQAAKALKEIKENIDIPLVADIHFDYRLALESAKHVDKLRINPGNIGDEDKIAKVVFVAKEYGLPIRIGVNLGSLEKDIEAKLGLTPEAMVESATRHIKLLEKHDFTDIIVSLKASDVQKTVAANRLFTKWHQYPLHLGITEAGSLATGSINTALGMGILLSQGIGNTIRVSLAADPIDEVRAGWQILKGMGLRQRGIKVIACPTCGRTKLDVAKIASELETRTQSINAPITVAIMGCSVNGPGEAKDADLGVVGTKEKAIIYRHGKVIDKIELSKAADRMIHEVEDEAHKHSG